MKEHWKDAANKASMEEAQCGQAVMGVAAQNTQMYNPPSLAAQAEKNAYYHQEQASKSQMAAAFFAANPAFDEFIRLIRSGAIQI